MTKPLIIIGGGGHAKVLADILLSQKREVIGVVDPSYEIDEGVFFDINCLGDDDSLNCYSPSETNLVNGLGSLPNRESRKLIFSKFKRRGYYFETVIHDLAYIGRNVTLKEGVQVMAGAIINTGTAIGENSIINTSSSIDHDCVIGKNCHIAPGAVLSGNVTLGDNVHVSTGASIINGIDVGNNTVLGNGVSINKDIKDNQIVYSAKYTCKQRTNND